MTALSADAVRDGGPAGPIRVWLVGAGPGDPGLLTVRARELLSACDCVIHDALVSPGILALIPPDAVRRSMGKRGRAASASQEAINAMLVEAGRRFRLVVRLKGGDPFLFGRGGEECAALAAARIPFGVVPGVTAGTGVPAYAGIPVTHRASSSAVAFVTGHQQRPADGAPVEPIDWSSVARIETVVLYMGMHRLAENCQAMIAAGRDPATPAAAIQWGTWHRQRTVVGTLADLPARAAAARLGAPAITVVGDVVTWRERIRWWDDPAVRPLWGRRILVTRAAAQASGLAEALAERGAEVVPLPLSRHEPAADPATDAALGAALDRRPAWIACASANAVAGLLDRLPALGRDHRCLAGIRLACVGAGTARALARRGLRADLISAPATAEALAAALLAAGGGSVLLPRADNGRPVLADLLGAAGWRVDGVTVYRSIVVPVAADDLPDPPPDAVTLASGATVDRLVDGVGRDRLAAWVAGGCRLYAIGPVTAAAVARHGLPVAGVAATAAIAALVTTVVSDLARQDGV
jgi:uroporphyrinogen III methyltransferase / synthase